MDRLRIAIVIPAFNEERTIGDVVGAASAFGQPVVVDDGSTDQTAACARAAGGVVVSLAVNQGYDGALDAGFRRAAEIGCEYVVTMDGDGQHDQRTLTAFIRGLDDGADVVLGIRDRRARFAETLFAWAAMWRWHIQDPLCGMKAYRIAVWRELGHFDSYKSIGTELALYAASAGKKIAQVPVPTRVRGGESRFGRRLSANSRILRAMWIGMASRPSTASRRIA